MEKVIRNYQIVLFLLIGAINSSCVKDTFNKSADQEKSQISAYVKVHYPGLMPTTDGLYFLSRVGGTGDTISATTDYVSITYSAWYLDGTLFDSTDTTLTIAGSYRSFKLGGPYTFSMGSNFYGLVEGIYYMREGETDTLLIPSTLSFNDFKPRIYAVTLHNVYHNIAATRKLEFDSTFIVPMGFALKDSTTAGRWIDTSKVIGTGVTFPVSGDTIAIKYTGMIMDDTTKMTINSITKIIPRGRIFEQYDSAKTIIGSALGPIFYEALTKMKRKGKAKVFVPYYNAYGANITYNSTTGQIVIPPYSNLMYDIEFLGFVNNKGIIDTTRRK